MNLTVEDGFPYYISLVGDVDVKQAFLNTKNLQLLSNISNEKAACRYAPGKWSIKQVVGHITDHERIMTYRILRFSRKDPTALPGYDQDLMVNNSRFDQLDYADLLEDLRNVRQASISLVNALSPEQFQLKGKAWKFELRVEDFLKATIGHEHHHIRVLKEKYLSL